MNKRFYVHNTFYHHSRVSEIVRSVHRMNTSYMRTEMIQRSQRFQFVLEKSLSNRIKHHHHDDDQHRLRSCIAWCICSYRGAFVWYVLMSVQCTKYYRMYGLLCCAEQWAISNYLHNRITAINVRINFIWNFSPFLVARLHTWWHDA